MLSLFSHLYGRLADTRNYLYERNILDRFDLGAHTISIGNITAGGTGKTPLVAYVAGVLAQRGEKVCVLTRGYGRKNPGIRVLVSDLENVVATPLDAGDEPFELANKLLGRAIVISDGDRVAAAEYAKRRFGITAFVLDDAFQHRKARRDLDIVCIDATNPFGGRKMLPAGRLREPLPNLCRADVVVITRSDLVQDISDLKFEISELAPNAAVFAARNKISRVIGLAEFHAKVQSTQSSAHTQPILAFCALGNPDSFYEMLRREDLNVVATEAFRDHHHYGQHDIERLESIARANTAEILFTTAKDAVKLSDLKFEIPCFVVEIETEIDQPDIFNALLLS